MTELKMHHACKDVIIKLYIDSDPFCFCVLHCHGRSDNRFISQDGIRRCAIPLFHPQTNGNHRNWYVNKIVIEKSCVCARA